MFDVSIKNKWVGFEDVPENVGKSLLENGVPGEIATEAVRCCWSVYGADRSCVVFCRQGIHIYWSP